MIVVGLYELSFEIKQNIHLNYQGMMSFIYKKKIL